MMYCTRDNPCARCRAGRAANALNVCTLGAERRRAENAERARTDNLIAEMQKKYAPELAAWDAMSYEEKQAHSERKALQHEALANVAETEREAKRHRDMATMYREDYELRANSPLEREKRRREAMNRVAEMDIVRPFFGQDGVFTPKPSDDPVADVRPLLGDGDSSLLDK